MTKPDAFDKALDVLIEEALEIVIEKECEELEAVEKREFSKEHERKMKKLFDKLRRDEWRERAVKYSKRAACICLIGLVLATTSICSVGAWRAWFLNFFFEEDAPNSKFNFNESGGKEYSDGNISLEYVPWGFEATKNTMLEHMIIILFEKDDLYFSVSMYSSNGQGSVDTEDATVSRVDINDCEAILVEKKDANQILWRDEENLFIVVGNINSDEIVKIAKNLKIL
ncbi:MAG: DUF4367 domain-containing protein [Clostridia bacterium]|nr:DUF4367 domain-containing protein [Clostridia bacterium]